MLKTTTLKGQMFQTERQLLYDVVTTHKPNVLLECGTMYAGGSTHAICCALNANKGGKLHTFEVNPRTFDFAKKGFQETHPDLCDFVSFHCVDFIDGIGKVGSNPIDFVFLDGPGGPGNRHYNILALDRLWPRLRNGSILAFHDWNMMKCWATKPVIRQHPEDFEILEVNGDSNGLAVVRVKM